MNLSQVCRSAFLPQLIFCDEKNCRGWWFPHLEPRCDLPGLPKSPLEATISLPEQQSEGSGSHLSPQVCVSTRFVRKKNPTGKESNRFPQRNSEFFLLFLLRNDHCEGYELMSGIFQTRYWKRKSNIYCWWLKLAKNYLGFKKHYILRIINWYRDFSHQRCKKIIGFDAAPFTRDFRAIPPPLCPRGLSLQNDRSYHELCFKSWVVWCVQPWNIPHSGDMCFLWIGNVSIQVEVIGNCVCACSL